MRLVSFKGEQVGIVSLAEALNQAQKVSLDLVEIVAQADPPVCKILDSGKYIFEAKKQQALAKKKQKHIQVKEVKFRPATDIGDYNVKLRNLTRFLEGGDKVKVTLRFRGREMAHQQLGMDMIKRVENDLSELAIVESAAKMEGRQLSMVLSSKKGKQKSD